MPILRLRRESRLCGSGATLAAGEDEAGLHLVLGVDVGRKEFLLTYFGLFQRG